MLHDLRSAARALLAQPGWTAAAIVCLAIATGGSTAAFSLVNGLLLRPLPFPHPDRLVMVALKEPTQPTTRPFALREYRALARASAGGTRLLARTFFPLSLRAADGARMAEAELVSANYFDTLGVTPALGRFFDPRDDRAGQSPAIVLSDRLWHLRYKAASDIIGRAVRLNGLPARVIGVAPPGFVGATQLVAADLWLPAAFYAPLSGSATAETVPMFGVIGRLPADISVSQATARLNTLATTVLAVRQTGATTPAIIVSPAAGFGVPPGIEGPVLTLSAFIYLMMALLIAVACANVAALLLVRGVRRRREVAIRASLGASHLRIARFLLAESLMLAAAGGVVGTVVAVWLTQALASSLSTPFQYVSYAIDVHPDGRVLTCAVLATLVTAGLCGLVPIRDAARTDPREALGDSPAGGRLPGSTRALRGIVAVQFALSTALLAGAAMLIRTYDRAASTPPSFHAAGVVAAEIDLAQLRSSPDADIRLAKEIVRRLSDLPDVTTVCLTRELPGREGRAVRLSPVMDGASSQSVAADEKLVSAHFFETLGLTALRGRTFTDGDPARPPVAVVNAELAKHAWPRTSPVGRLFTVEEDPDHPIEVVGVVPNLENRMLHASPRPAFYRLFPQASTSDFIVLARARNATGSLFPAIRRTIRGVDPDLSIVDLRTLDDRLSLATDQWRLTALVLTPIGLLALVLSAVGLFGVVSFVTRARTRELGIRLALGAHPADLWRLVLRQGLQTVSLGLMFGLLVASGLAVAIRRTLFGVLPLDALTLLAVSAVLLAVAVAALSLPARSASRVDPAQTLHTE